MLRLSGGDARRALTYLEEAAAGAQSRGSKLIDADTVAAAVDKAAVRYDRAGDQHYDVISAFIKSVRGSDVQASLHYLARMFEAGEDPVSWRVASSFWPARTSAWLRPRSCRPVLPPLRPCS